MLQLVACPVLLPTNVQFRAAIAQLGERQTEDLKVPGSIPGGGTLRSTSPMAQSVARQAVNLQVAGSNPAGGDFADGAPPQVPRRRSRALTVGWWEKRSPGIEPGFPRPQRGVLTTKL